jgi:hypothetical protein
MIKFDKTNVWTWAGLFIISLMISLPFYSADVMAVSLQITKNTGSADIDGYLDAEGDIWKVEATISDTGENEVVTEDVKIKVGNNVADFTSCTAEALGATCVYESALDDGIQENSYDFSVQYNYLNNLGVSTQIEDNAIVYADGSAPVISVSGEDVRQSGEDVQLEFSVREESLGVGISSVKIIDSDSGDVLQEINDFSSGEREYLFDGTIDAVFSGEGNRAIKIRAEDYLGHTSTSRRISFYTDFAVPEILNEFNLTGFTEFVGQYSGKSTNILVYIKDLNLDKATVKASSKQLDLSDDLSDGCSLIEIEESLWECRWNNVELLFPESIVSLTVSASDDYGNSVEKEISLSYTKDISAPEIEFFGTKLLYDDQSYVKNGENVIVARINDQGSGVNTETIQARLGELGGINRQLPKACNKTDEIVECYWEVSGFSASGRASVGASISYLEDNVGNTAETYTEDFIVDNVVPKVSKVELFGVSTTGVKNYFQSRDQVLIRMEIEEDNGLLVLVDMDDVMNDAEDVYPSTAVSEEGWAVFSQENCEREDALWKCEFLTSGIKSGPESSVNMEIKVLDSAMNEANAITEARNVKVSGGVAKFEILGVDEEVDPDFWMAKEKDVSQLLNFIDLDTTELIPTRMPLEVKLRSNNSRVKALSISALDCALAEDGVGPELRRVLVKGSNFVNGEKNPKTTLIVEFLPFNGRELFNVQDNKEFRSVTADYICRLKVFSKVGDNAISSAEIQEVPVSVKFAFSSLGSLDENLASKIKTLKGSQLKKFYDAIHYVSQAFEWLDYVVRILNVVVTITKLIDIFSVTQVSAAESMEDYKVTAAIGVALRGGCMGAQEGQKQTLSTIVKYIQIPAKILSCSPDPGQTDWYGTWQNGVLDTYNVITGRATLGISAGSVYENMYVSGLALCLPGIVYNIEKAREIYCRKIVCYGTEVPSGIATFDGCDKLYDLQMCEFVYGPLVQMIPFLDGVAQLGKMLQSMFTSPLGVISLAEIIGCFPLCFMKKDYGSQLMICKITTALNKLISIVDTIVGAVKVRPDITGAPYCKMADSIDTSKLIGSSAEETVEDTADEEEEVVVEE